MKKILMILALIAGSSARADFADIYRQAKEAGKKLETAIKSRDFEGVKGGVTELGGLIKEQAKLAKIKEYPADTKTSVEIKNKGSLIFVTVKVGGAYYTQDSTGIFEVKPGTVVALSPELTKGLEIAVYNEKPQLDKTVPLMKYRLPANKTAYLTWDDKVLRPQTGLGKGFLEVTDSGLSLKKNVKAADMKTA
jgi:hypothetical protein